MAELLTNSPAMWETWVQSLGWEHPVEKGTATHSSILALENSMDCIVHGVAKSRTKNSPNILGVLLIHICYCVEKTNINNLARVYMVELMNSWVLFVCVCVCVCVFQQGMIFLGKSYIPEKWPIHIPEKIHYFVTFLFKWGIFCKGMATYCNILGWKFPWAKNPDRLQSMVSQRVRQDWVTKCTRRFIRSSAHKLEPMYKSVCKCGYMSV